MSVDEDYPIGETFVDLQSNIERKRYALDILDSEYNKICLKSESNLKYIEELASKMYNLDSYLKSIECRVVEYDKKEKDWEKEANVLQKNMEELQISFVEEKTLTDSNDIEFDEHVLKLVRNVSKDRDIFDSSTTEEQTDNLNDANSSIAQETCDIRQALLEIKQKHPFVPPEEVLFILKNCKFSCFLESEIENLEKVKKFKLETLNELKKIISSMEQEIKCLLVQ